MGGVIWTTVMIILINECTGVFGSSNSIRIIGPQPAKAGQTIRLECLRWNNHSGGSTADDDQTNGAGNSRYYQVKWHKDGNQVYKYSNDGEQFDFPQPGVQVVLKESNDRVLVLRDVNRATEGKYSCEVMEERPQFRTITGSIDIQVVELPEKPIIQYAKSMYRVGDILNISCTAHRARPFARISFIINEREYTSHSEKVTLLPVLEEPGGTYTSVGWLLMRIMDVHTPVLKITCRAKVRNLIEEQTYLARVEEAVNTFASWFGSSGCRCPKASCYLTLLLLVLTAMGTAVCDRL